MPSNAVDPSDTPSENRTGIAKSSETALVATCAAFIASTDRQRRRLKRSAQKEFDVSVGTKVPVAVLKVCRQDNRPRVALKLPDQGEISQARRALDTDISFRRADNLRATAQGAKDAEQQENQRRDGAASFDCTAELRLHLRRHFLRKNERPYDPATRDIPSRKFRTWIDME